MGRPVVNTVDVCSGAPRIDGSRLTCANVVLSLGLNGMDVEQFLASHSYLDKNDVEECVRYCSQQRCVEDSVLNFCQGCSLDRRANERPDFADAPADAPSVHFSTENDVDPINVWEIAAMEIARWEGRR
ncbi:DUF433 domain-containing protein [Lignipirellula cremea]|uniref:DUF433 domain-containing protein n=1 Tax=Lignipirellula cremea TaxID=2528010 RepID=UPI0011A71D76